MSANRVFSQRLLELERVLARDRDGATANSAIFVDPVAHHLGSVRAERIRHYTAALQPSHSPDTNNDDVDLLTMRLLLNELVTSIRHLRGVTDMVATTLDRAAKPVQESDKFIKREEQREERKRLAAAHATDRP